LARDRGFEAGFWDALVPSLPDSVVISAYPGLTPWANVFFPFGAVVDNVFFPFGAVVIKIFRCKLQAKS